jgi:hypothetical protein
MADKWTGPPLAVRGVLGNRGSEWPTPLGTLLMISRMDHERSSHYVALISPVV